MVTERGQLFGDPDHECEVQITNGRHFSYTGYNEILTGHVDASIDSNDKRSYLNMTVLEWLQRKSKHCGRVVDLESWDVFPFILNGEPSGIEINVGWQLLDNFRNETDKVRGNTFASELTHYW